LKLAGSSSWTGGTEIDGGVLEADSTTALGDGDVVVASGTLFSNAQGGLKVGGGYNQLPQAVLSVDLGSAQEGTVTVAGEAGLGGTLDVSVQPGLTLNGDTTVPVLTAAQRVGTFAAVNVSGTTAKYKVVYTGSGVSLEFNPVSQ
jgi:autotransporter-associated beta strand protein